MAEQGSSKAFGEYTGQRVSAVPEGFLSAYAQVAKNYQGIGEDVGKAVGGMIADYRANRKTEDLLNQKTSSPEFMKGLGDTLTGARKKQGDLLDVLRKAGVNPDLEDDPYDIQHQENLDALAKSPAAGEAYALLKAYGGVHSIGESFLKDPSKFDNKKKMQLIGAVTTSVETMTAEAKTEAEKKAAALKTRQTMADINAKEGADAAARAPAYTPQSAVRDALGLATTMTAAQAQGRMLQLQAQAELEAQDNYRRGGVGEPSETTAAQLIAVTQYAQSVAKPETVSEGVPLVEADPFVSVEAAQERLAVINEKLKVPNNPQAKLLTAQKEELETGIENAKMDKSDTIYSPEVFGLLPDERIVENNRKFNMAVSLIENMNGIQTKSGKLMLPSLSLEDRKNLYRMIELGGTGIRSAEDGVLYDVDDNGFITAKPMTEDEIKATLKRSEGPVDPKTRLALVKAAEAEMKSKANIGSRNFGEFEVSTRTVPNGPDGKSESLSVVNGKRGERILFVPNRPDLNLWMTGKMNTDGTPTSKNVQEFREKMAAENELLNALESARDVLHLTPKQVEDYNKTVGPTGVKLDPAKRHRKVTLEEPDMVIYLQRLYSMKRAMGKGLGPLSRGDYQLLETNVFAQVPNSAINFEEPNVIKQFLGKEWKELTRDVATMEKQLFGIQADVKERALTTIRSGSSVWAVDENEQRVDDGFNISHGLLTDDSGKLTTKHVYLSTKDGKSEYKIFDARNVAKGYFMVDEPAKRKEAHEAFEEVMKDQYMNNKLLREKYLYLLNALQRRKGHTMLDSATPLVTRQKDVELGKAMLIERLEYVGMPAALIQAYVGGIEEGL